MTKRISDTAPVKEFVDVARNFCLLIEKREEKGKIQFLQEVFACLPQLLLFVMKLPEIQRFTDYEVGRLPFEQGDEIYKSLQSKLGKHDCYRKIFDPCNQEDQEPIYGSLADDLRGIYNDIKPGLNEWEEATAVERLSIIWHWKFFFEMHCGAHMTGAVQALYWLLYNHIEDEDGDYVGLRIAEIK